ncbi:MAG: hypothetical protein WDN06_06695 [Asticcacaulis sp.]
MGQSGGDGFEQALRELRLRHLFRSGRAGRRSARSWRTGARHFHTDAPRKSVILGKYRTGDVTSSAKDDSAKGTISDAIK